ncbi:MAG: methyltransferase [Vicinamibacterales bacterium]
MARLRLSPTIALAADDNGYVAYDLRSRLLSHLNPAAALITELCDGTRTAADIEAAVGPLLGPLGAQACRAWIESARTSGLITETVTAEHAVPCGADQTDARVFSERAWELRDEGLIQAAFVCQWQAAYLDSASASQWHALGELAHILGRRAVAHDAYDQYLTLEPDDAEIAHVMVSLRDEAPPPRAPDRCIEQLYARFASFYDENMCGDLDYCAPACLDTAIRQVLGEPRDLDVLELGCGTGLAGRLLRAYARRLIGIDLSQAMVTRAAATGLYDRLEVAEITEWLGRSSAVESPVNLVAACDALIYFGDLAQVVVPASAYLANGGCIAFTLELTDIRPFRLTDSGRYAHHPDHVRDVAAVAGLAVRQLDVVTLRYEYGEAVSGLVAVLQKPDGS